MRTLTKKIWLWLFMALFSVCCVFLASATFTKKVAKAEAALALKK